MEMKQKLVKVALLIFTGKFRKPSALPENNKHNVTIMIDDTSLMEVVAYGCSDHVLDFLHYCHTLTSEIGCSLVILDHEDIYSIMEGPTFMLQMEYLADVLIKAEPLSTSLAADVNGQHGYDFSQQKKSVTGAEDALLPQTYAYP